MVDAASPVASAPGLAVSWLRRMGLVLASLESRGRPQPHVRLWQTAGTSTHVGESSLPEPPLAAATLLRWKLGGGINELQNKKHPVLLLRSGAG